MKLKCYKIRPKAKLPVRVYSVDAGMDVFYCPTGEDEPFSIPTGSSRVIPTGLKIKVPECYMLEVKNKSGVASKNQLIVGACVIDPGYTGEIYVNLHNIGRSTQEIIPNQKIAQAVLIKTESCDIEEVFTDPQDKKTLRGSGGFGSTGEF